MDFVSIDTWTLIFTWINLFILFLIMKKLLFKPIMNIIEAREKEVSDMYEKAETAQKNAQNMEAEYTQKLSEAKDEASRILKEATHSATLKGEQIIADARDKASAEISKAEKEIEREKASAISEVKEDIASIAVSIAEKVIEKDINEQDYVRLAEAFIEGGDVQ